MGPAIRIFGAHNAESVNDFLGRRVHRLRVIDDSCVLDFVYLGKGISQPWMLRFMKARLGNQAILLEVTYAPESLHRMRTQQNRVKTIPENSNLCITTRPRLVVRLRFVSISPGARLR